MFVILFLPIFLLAINYDDLFDINFSADNKNVLFSQFHVKECKKDIYLDISNRLDLAKYEYYNNDIGVFLDVGGNINDKSSKESLNVGLTWKLLKGGYRDNQYKAEIINIQNQLKKMENKQIDNSFSYYNDYNFIIYFYNKKKIDLLNKYLKFLEFKFNLFKRKYFLKMETIDKLLSIKQQINDIKNLKQNYELFNKKVICKNDIDGEIIDFDLKYEEILKDIKVKNSYFVLNNKIVDKKYDIYNNWNLDLYVNREVLTDKGDNFGFSLSIPLSKNNSELKRLEKLKSITTKKELEIRKYLYFQKNYYTFRYKLSDLINMRFKLAYIQAQFKRAKLRYKFHIGNDNLDRIVSNIDSMFGVKLQILDIKQQLLLKAYSILYNLGLEFKDKYIKPIKIDTSLKLRPGNRSLYIWANGFKKYDNSLLIEFFKLKNIKEVMISISKYQNFQKLENFIKLAKKNHIKVIYLLQYKHKMKKLNYDINEVNIYFEKVDNNIQDYLNQLHKDYPKYQIDVTIENNISLPPFINKVYGRLQNVDWFEIKANKYKNELELELDIQKVLKQYHNIAIYNLKTYMKVLQ